MYSVDLYRRVRLACHHDHLSRREAARLFGVDRKTIADNALHNCTPRFRKCTVSALYHLLLADNLKLLKDPECYLVDLFD